MPRRAQLDAGSITGTAGMYGRTLSASIVA
jgi:hypothetical protein